MITKEEALNLFRQVHNGKYTYIDLPDIIGSHERIRILCQQHGEFVQEYRNHAKGCGCRKCAAIKGNEKRKCDQSAIIKRFKEIHGDRYSYEKVDYKTYSTKVEIICPIHGSFFQTPAKHLRGDGCPKCRLKYRDTQHFVEECKKVRPELDYSKTNYVNFATKSVFTCQIHGDFEKFPYCVSVRGEGCPICSRIEKAQKSCKSTEYFLQKCKERGIDVIYDLSNTEYVKSDTRINVVCHRKFKNGKEHGMFRIFPHNLLNGYGCPRCSKERKNSLAEDELFAFIADSTNKTVIRSDWTLLGDRELDIYLPELNLAFELDGLYWHSEVRKDKNEMLNKTKRCSQKGVKLIHIYEDEWNDKRDIVKSRVLSLLGGIQERIYARKCVVKEITQKECDLFVNKFHLQGAINAKVRIGLFFNDELVSIMSFTGLRRSLGYQHRENHYELLRFCCKSNLSVVGAASKMFSYFTETYKPKVVVSFSDIRWGDGSVYRYLGFSLHYTSKPNYYYIVGHHRENRFKYRKSVLVKQGFDKSKSEHEIMLERKIYRIYDCGCAVWLYNAV